MHLTEDIIAAITSRTRVSVSRWTQACAMSFFPAGVTHINSEVAFEERDGKVYYFFYADGHVRIYHGKLTDLPRRYIARERLCLRGTTDYWVDAMDGRPFFVVSCAVDPGLLSVLPDQIVPRLKVDVPNQPTQEQLDDDPLLSRFTIVFDREGYSPQFFAQMKEQRIAILEN